MASKGFPSLSVNDSGQTPECSICSERYDDSDEDLIPRNLACGHSLCSSKLLQQLGPAQLVLIENILSP